MPRAIATDAAPPSFSDYAQAVETPPGARLLHVSGQVGARPDGTLAEDPEAQHEQAWRNVFAILAAADMGPTDIVDVLAIVTDPAGVPIFRKVRDRMLKGHLACSTLLISGLASPAWKVEIAVTAARV
ncbi:MAG: Rid family hydrolase [Rhodobacter sp.]|nr:Rid family hydrolase [Rhodobacter sp.]